MTSLSRPAAAPAGPERVALRAGPLTMLFEPGSGFVRHIRLGEREVLRGVYAAVRDRNWYTVPPRVELTELDRGEDRFRLAFEAVAREGEIHFAWRAELAGDPDGTLRYTLDGRALSTFLRNRIGFCVLHPPECAGVACEVEHVDGSREAGCFPRDISPHQPFLDLRALRHRVAPGLEAEVRFEGDVFEMEDQRNWTDASFKTYCTPLRLPFPVEVREGTGVRQAVTLRLHGRAAAPPVAAPRDEVEIRVDASAPLPLPGIGLTLPARDPALSSTEADRLRALSLAHLRVDLRLRDPSAGIRLREADAVARAAGAALEAALFVTDAAEEELASLRAVLEEVRPRVVRWLVLHEAEQTTSARWVRLARHALDGTGAPVGGGTDAYFTQLNRERPTGEELEVVCFSLNPQVHAFDDLSLAETLPMQGEVVRNARRIVPGVAVAVTPVTLRPRFSPTATAPEEPVPGRLPRSVDPRQATPFAAAWTLGSLKHLTEAGAASVTYFETTGRRGVMERGGEPGGEGFPSVEGGVFPLYHVLADFGEMRGGEVLPATSSDPLGAEALLLRRGDAVRLLLANPGLESRHVRVRLPFAWSGGRIRVLDRDSAHAATRDPDGFRRSGRTIAGGAGEILLELVAHASACVDLDASRPLEGR